MTTHTTRPRRRSALVGFLALLLGVGLAPAALTVPASGQPSARGDHRSTTTLTGFAAAPAAVVLGGAVVDKVKVLPKARREVRIQARRPGGSRYVTVSSGTSSKRGVFHATYRPTQPGTWRYRLLLPATNTARRLVSVSRAVTATTDTTAPGPVTAVTVVHGTTSDLTLSWKNPTAPDFAGVMIRRALGPTAPASPSAGVLVTTTSKAVTSYTDKGLAGSTPYSYALFAFDAAKNNASRATVSATSGAVTAAVLSVNGSTGATAKQTVNQSEAFDISGTHAGLGRTLVSGNLDYGDGTSESFTGDPTTWLPALHQYTATGPVTATWTVVDSASKVVSTSTQIQVYDAPTATISVVTAGVLEKNHPISFAITSTTPAGTAFTDFDTFSVLNGVLGNFVDGPGAPPPTLTLTFATPGTYTVVVDGFNDAGGFASAEIDVVIVDAPN